MIFLNVLQAKIWLLHCYYLVSMLNIGLVQIAQGATFSNQAEFHPLGLKKSNQNTYIHTKIQNCHISWQK